MQEEIYIFFLKMFIETKLISVTKYLFLQNLSDLVITSHMLYKYKSICKHFFQFIIIVFNITISFYSNFENYDIEFKFFFITNIIRLLEEH